MLSWRDRQHLNTSLNGVVMCQECYKVFLLLCLEVGRIDWDQTCSRSIRGKPGILFLSTLFTLLHTFCHHDHLSYCTTIHTYGQKNMMMQCH